MSAAGSDPGSYRSLFGDLRAHLRTYLAKLILLPQQEIRELVSANLAALRWIGIAAGLLLLAAIGFVVLLIELLALLPQPWLGTVALAFAAGVAVALVVAAVRARSWRLTLGAILGGLVLVGIGVLAWLFFPQPLLSAMLVVLTLVIFAIAAGYTGYRKLVLRGPERSIRSVKETLTWVTATLRGRSAS